MKFYTLRCFDCQKEHSETESVTSCLICGGPLETYYNYDAIHERLNMYALKHAPISAMKYLPLYPIDNFKNIISLQEGGTPLIRARKLGKKLGLTHLYIKNEGVNPTGCFKDRGTLVEITKAKELGAEAICLASTGNMAASCAAYASAAGIPCYVLVPEGTPIGKIAQTLIFGARVIQVRGSYSECATLAEQMAKKFGYYLAGDYTFRTEGQKSQGYEIIEQLFWESPDYIVCPIGCGTNFHAIYRGVKEFHDLGLVKKMPKLIGVQAEGANAVVRAFDKGDKDFPVLEAVNTIAGAIAVASPLDGRKILDDIYKTGGNAVSVNDEELLLAQQEQARTEGVFAEPSGAAAIAAVKKLQAQNFFNPDDVIVCIATGNGLKDPKSPLQILPEPASIEPVFSEIEKFIEHKLYAIKESGRAERKKMLITKLPTQAALAKIIETEFTIVPNDEIVSGVFAGVQNFLEKGKEILKSDLQYILEEVLDEISLTDRKLEILDFEISTSLRNKAHAKVDVKIFGEERCFISEGSGPVDAIISALYQGLKDHDKREVRLVDYAVEIDSNSVDASVEVKMTLQDNEENKVISKTTSPDIIVASIRAYEKGFNLLYGKDSR